MFVTEPQHEFSICSRLGTSGNRHWRLVHVSAHTLWFVLTVEVPDGDMALKRTACVASDTDLAALLDSLGDARAVSLLCMMPGRWSTTGQWTTREVREVWEARSAAGDLVILLRDEHGCEFGDESGLRSPRSSKDRRLILKL